MKIISLLLSVACALATSSDWSVLNGGIMYKNTTFYIKGANFFGAETCDFVPHGLWVHPLTFYLDFVKENKFNVIRLPFSQHWALNGFDAFKPNQWAITADPSLQGLFTFQVIDRLMDECAKRGIFVLFDMHRLRCEDQGHELWYSISDDKFTSDTFFKAWGRVLGRWSSHPAFHGIDLLNEPRGLAEWGNNPSTSWNLFVKYAFETFADYDGLIYVEGVRWGRDFSGMRHYPIEAPRDRLVFSPHVYGPSVAPVASMDTFSLHGDWDNTFGWLIADKEAVVIGEFGGRYLGADKVWQDLFVSYLNDLRIPGLYWCINPNSGDSGGLLKDDWTTPEYDKLKLLDKLQPYPTIINPKRNLRTNHHPKEDDNPWVIVFSNSTNND